jgi:threonine synthase
MSDAMEYASLQDLTVHYSFKEVVQKSIAPDGSLFVPSRVPQMDAGFLTREINFDLKNAAHFLLSPFVGNDLNALQLRQVIAHTFQFELPVVQLSGSDIFIEELYHGPTHAFKDVGARFLAGCLQQWRTNNEKTTVLVATSGDTGGAVANAFFGLEEIDVVILYPKGKISSYQEQQIAGLGKNIRAIAVHGNFDQCQQLVKQAFADKSLSGQIQMTSANSINIGRWLPQMMFYAVAWHHMEKKDLEKTMVVPSGNYGNISAGILFHSLGFLFANMIAAHNQNDTIPRYLTTHQYQPHPTIATYANAMDISDPSNFARFEYLRKLNRGNSFHFSAKSVSNKEILAAIRDCWDEHHYLIDPHTATGYHVLKMNGGHGTILATAHPYKFKEIILKALGFYPEEWRLEEKEKKVLSLEIDVDFKSLKEMLIQS